MSFMIDERRVLDHGYIGIARVDGSDKWVTIAARTSYRDEAEKFSEAENCNLVEYLIANKHNTPVEFCGAVVYAVMPIFVARQWVRHRTASINEESLRYVEARNQFYVPDVSRMQKKSTNSKQGSSPELIDGADYYNEAMRKQNEQAFLIYRKLLAQGLAPELARTVLPLSTYTAWYWQANLHNILHFLLLRMDPHAQYEVRVYADAMYEMLKCQFPMVFKAWENHVLKSVSFSAEEQLLVRRILEEGSLVDCGWSKRKLTAFAEKVRKLGIDFKAEYRD